MNNAVLMVIRALTCIALIFAGGVIATEVNAIVGCLVSATGLIALAAPLIIETDNIIDERNRQARLQQTWERYNGKWSVDTIRIWLWYNGNNRPKFKYATSIS